MNNQFAEDVRDDIIKEKESLADQVALLEPMVKGLKQSTGLRLVSSGSSILMEIILWALAIGALIYAALLMTIFPFSNLGLALVAAKKENPNFTLSQMNTIEYSVKALVVIIGILLVVIARQLAKLRLKSSGLHLAGKNIEGIRLELQERQAALQAFEQKYDYLLNANAKISVDGFSNPLTPPQNTSLNTLTPLPPPTGDEYL